MFVAAVAWIRVVAATILKEERKVFSASISWLWDVYVIPAVPYGNGEGGHREGEEEEEDEEADDPCLRLRSLPELQPWQRRHPGWQAHPHQEPGEFPGWDSDDQPQDGTSEDRVHRIRRALRRRRETSKDALNKKRKREEPLFEDI